MLGWWVGVRGKAIEKKKHAYPYTQTHIRRPIYTVETQSGEMRSDNRRKNKVGRLEVSSCGEGGMWWLSPNNNSIAMREVHGDII